MTNSWVVVTSINSPQRRYSEYLNLGWNLVVVGDKKSNDQTYADFAHDGFHYLSVTDQERLYPELSALIGFNTYARKNLGYLFAMSQGAKEIWDTDDDTFWRDQTKSPIEILSGGDAYVYSGHLHMNPYSFFGRTSGLWPRGYPLRHILLDKEEGFAKLDKPATEALQSVDILQTLVNLEPDVDAIYRLTVSAEVMDFPVSKDVVLLDDNHWVAANTQSTLWMNPRKFKYLYVPRHISLRFTDIFKMYVAQSFARLGYAGFLSEQYRNPHDFLVDFESEVDCYLQTEKLVELLSAHRNADMTLSAVYEICVETGIAKPAELEIIKEFERIVNSYE